MEVARPLGTSLVTIPYSSGDFFGLLVARLPSKVEDHVTIPYSSGDFFGPRISASSWDALGWM